MQHAPADIQFAAAVLEGAVATSGAWGAPGRGRSRGGRGAGRGQQQQGPRRAHQAARGGGGGASAGGGRQPNRLRHRTQQPPPPPQQQQREPRRRGAAAAADEHSSSSSSSSSDAGGSDSSSSGGEGALAAYRRPGPRSTQHMHHCAACDVFVPRRRGDWDTHVAGIRHQRQLLSLRVHGAPNRLVLSAFESMPDSSEGLHRLVGRAAADFGLAAGGAAQQAQQAAPAPPELQQAARRLRTEALKQLLSMFGAGQIYSAAAAEFEERQLAAALAAAQRNQLGLATGYWSTGSAATLAALAHLAQAGHLDAAGSLGIDVWPNANAPRSQHAALAAALTLLVQALPRAPSSRLEGLKLHLLSTSGGQDAARLAEVWAGGWQHTLPALRGLLESHVPLRTLHLELPACLQDATAAYLPQLQAGSAAARAGARRHVLLGLHPRAGRGSLLQLLPLEVVRRVLDLAAPLQPCAISLRWT